MSLNRGGLQTCSPMTADIWVQTQNPDPFENLCLHLSLSAHSAPVPGDPGPQRDQLPVGPRHRRVPHHRRLPGRGNGAHQPPQQRLCVVRASLTSLCVVRASLTVSLFGKSLSYVSLCGKSLSYVSLCGKSLSYRLSCRKSLY